MTEHRDLVKFAKDEVESCARLSPEKTGELGALLGDRSSPRASPLMQPKSILADMIVEDTTSLPMWEILVPTVSNAGKPFSVRHHRQWDAMVKRLVGGMTLVKPVRGSWVDPETEAEYTERMIPVRIVCTREQITAICKETARFYDQLAVLATLVATETVMVSNPNASLERHRAAE